LISSQAAGRAVTAVMAAIEAGPSERTLVRPCRPLFFALKNSKSPAGAKKSYLSRTAFRPQDAFPTRLNSEKLVMAQNKKFRKTVLLWGETDQDDDDTVIMEESTYISPYVHKAANDVEVYFKAGTKEYALAGKNEDSKLKISPVQLKKKYR
jgi:hypothetical protein